LIAGRLMKLGVLNSVAVLLSEEEPGEALRHEALADARGTHQDQVLSILEQSEQGAKFLPREEAVLKGIVKGVRHRRLRLFAHNLKSVLPQDAKAPRGFPT